MLGRAASNAGSRLGSSRHLVYRNIVSPLASDFLGKAEFACRKFAENVTSIINAQVMMVREARTDIRVKTVGATTFSDSSTEKKRYL